MRRDFTVAEVKEMMDGLAKTPCRTDSDLMAKRALTDMGDTLLAALEDITSLRADVASLTASLAGEVTQSEKLIAALHEIVDRHIPDQPAAYGGTEDEWARRQHTELRRIARAALGAP